MPTYSAATGDDAPCYGRYSCPDCRSDMEFWDRHPEGFGSSHATVQWAFVFSCAAAGFATGLALCLTILAFRGELR